MPRTGGDASADGTASPGDCGSSSTLRQPIRRVIPGEYGVICGLLGREIHAIGSHDLLTFSDRGAGGGRAQGQYFLACEALAAQAHAREGMRARCRTAVYSRAGVHVPGATLEDDAAGCGIRIDRLVRKVVSRAGNQRRCVGLAGLHASHLLSRVAIEGIAERVAQGLRSRYPAGIAMCASGPQVRCRAESGHESRALTFASHRKSIAGARRDPKPPSQGLRASRLPNPARGGPGSIERGAHRLRRASGPL